MPREIKIQTWSCGCGYNQDFEPTQQNMNIHFNRDERFRLTNVRANECPSCKLKGNSGRLSRETDNSKKITVKILTEQEVDDMDIRDEVTLEKRKLSNEEKQALKDDIRQKEAVLNLVRD